MVEVPAASGSQDDRRKYQYRSVRPPLGVPLVRKMDAKLWEVRSTIEAGITRVLFITSGPFMVLLHGFIKKSGKTPKNDLALALHRAKEVRHG